MTAGPSMRWLERRSWAVLVALAYVPALLSGRGRMPADSKLYLYLDPGRFLGDAAASFDPRQFAGWVPHQHVAYLWPAGPWFWLFEALGVPDWVAHRLWIGTLLAAAGLGVRWCARTLGLTPAAALAAAFVYQLSPYLLPYVSRTSVMLLPWAGLGWIVGLTVRATRRADTESRLARWLDPAALALVVLTVGAVNATALAMIVPAPVLWLVHAMWLGDVRWRPALGVAARTALLSAGVSVWWIAMLMIQGRYGADVLPYSESLADVSFTATGSEVWRGLGYWLFYIRDQFAPTTTASLPYLASTGALLVSFLVPVLALLALTTVRWRHRRFGALLLASGLVLAVGVHPIDDRSPLMRVLTGSSDDGLALALRSSTRALPVAVLGMALLIGAGVMALGTWWSRPVVSREWVAAGLVGVIALANLPSLWKADLVDPALERDQHPPAAWQAAAGALDDASSRVLQLPGLEFGAFRWGYTVDQPLAAMSTNPLVTRDLLPLGSPAAMNLLYALDDRIQDGVLEPSAIATVARLLGVSHIWLTNDAAYDRFDVTHPAIVRAWLTAAAGLGAATSYGPLTVNTPTVEMADGRYLARPGVGDPAPQVELFPLEEPAHTVRAAAASIVVSGDGDGVIDGAAAGLLPGAAAIAYSAAASDDALGGLLVDSAGLLVTDSNRARGRHWRSSQDAIGFTESAGRDGALPTELTEPAVGDARLPVFADTGEHIDPSTLTTAEQRGPVIARASGYGQPFALLPEHRPFMAVDGDPSTAWIVGEHGDPLGETFMATLTDPSRLPTALTIIQYAGELGQRQISRLTLRYLGADGERIADPVSVDVAPAGDRPTSVSLAPPVGTVAIAVTIDGLSPGTAFTAGAVAGVGFAEFDLGLGPTREVVIVPDDAIRQLTGDTPVAYLFSRLRTDPSDRWRDDPETTLVREFDTPGTRELTAHPTLRLDARASDAALGELLGWPVTASSRLLGRPEHAGPAAVDGDPATAWITDYESARGAALHIDGVAEPISEITVRQPTDGFTRVTELVLAVGDEQRTVALTEREPGVAVATVTPPLPAGDLVVAVAEIEPAHTTDRRFGDRFELPAAITELELPGLPGLPDYTDAHALTGCVPVAAVDGRELAVMVTTSGQPSANPSWLGPTELVALQCGAEWAVTLPGGTHLLEAVDTGLPIHLDRVALREPFRGVAARPTVHVTDRSQFGRTIEVEGCTDGCWVVLGEGYNEAWSASIRGVDLGGPTMLDGGFTGWWVDAELTTDGAFTLYARWTAQRAVSVAYALSALAALACVAIVVLALAGDRAGARATVPGAEFADSAGDPTGGVRHALNGARDLLPTSIAWVVVGFLLVGPWGAAWGALAAVGTFVLRHSRVAELTATATLAVVAVAVTLRERRLAPMPDGGWPHVFERYHGLAMFAVAAMIVAALFADDADRRLPSAP